MIVMQSWLSEQHLGHHLNPVIDHRLLLGRVRAHTTFFLSTLVEPVRSVLIPSGCTPLVQPLDVRINTTFLNRFAWALPRMLTYKNNEARYQTVTTDSYASNTSACSTGCQIVEESFSTDDQELVYGSRISGPSGLHAGTIVSTQVSMGVSHGLHVQLTVHK